MKILLETVLKYWDIGMWGVGRFIFWLLIVVAVLLFIVWLFEFVIAPIAEAFKRWRTYCPECGGLGLQNIKHNKNQRVRVEKGE